MFVLLIDKFGDMIKLILCIRYGTAIIPALRSVSTKQRSLRWNETDQCICYLHRCDNNKNNGKRTRRRILVLHHYWRCARPLGALREIRSRGLEEGKSAAEPML